MTLDEKAQRYRRGGKYLAQKEENEYVLENITYWYAHWCVASKDLRECFHSFGNYLSCQIGTWQANKGFTRAYRPKRKKAQK